ncbi:MAG: hypothetical protein LQ340_003308 [Diploschistes diacapsis]|nr:MAG: hypothetical protein LQ340_003308 [Diploschistes diacapsis]
MASVLSYQISIEDSQISDLKQRLSLARFPDELEGAGWDLGCPLSDIKRLTRYWFDEFDWRKAERELNNLPHFMTVIQCKGFDALDIHFLHRKSKVEGAIPLLFVHGWPGSFLEVTKLLKLLTDPPFGQVAFDVVAPSLPNFGFSGGIKRRGFATEQYAETLHKLMTEKLGYKQYVTQGGDWGYEITRAIAFLYPECCRANHLNMDGGFPLQFLSDPESYLQSKRESFTPREQAGLEHSASFQIEGTGYDKEQSTKPQTLGYALANDPVALLAWIYEKLHDWTDNYPWTEDEILTWISVYWFSTAGPAASCRIYYEVKHDGPPGHAETTGRKEKLTWQRLNQHLPVKTGFSHFPRDIYVLPKEWTRSIGDVVFERDHDEGGHFAAWERPDIMVEDVRAMFGKRGGAYGVVDGRSGY